jgi:hypothetical protein
MALALAFTFNAGAQTPAAKAAPTLRSVLLDQLRSTHDKSDWFVCANVAVANLTPEQANWKDGKGNHSVGQLTYHLVFWNQRALQNFRGKSLQSSAATTTRPSTTSTPNSGRTPFSSSIR